MREMRGPVRTLHLPSFLPYLFTARALWDYVVGPAVGPAFQTHLSDLRPTVGLAVVLDVAADRLLERVLRRVRTYMSSSSSK